MTDLKAPFSYFGGKSRVADEIWRRFGDPKRYIEPFCGSAAVLLKRPGGAPEYGSDEIINDLDGFITNFYRTVKRKPAQLVKFIDRTVSELDLHARRDWLQGIEDDLVENLRADPHYCHVKAAAWWCWGACQWIGSGWPHESWDQKPNMRAGGILSGSKSIENKIKMLSKRLRGTKILCGDWYRSISSNTMLYKNNSNSSKNDTSVFLDPPYPVDTGSNNVYTKGQNGIAYDVEEWCIKKQDDSALKIAVCGYNDTYHLPKWTKYHWSASGGYGNQGKKENKNRFRETIWFSPSCEEKKQKTLL